MQDSQTQNTASDRCGLVHHSGARLGDSKPRNRNQGSPPPWHCQLLPILLAGHCLCSVRAADVSWNNPAGGAWNVAANWSPAQIPGPNDVAILGGSGSYIVTAAANITLGGLRIGGEGATKTLRLDSGTLALNGAGLVRTNGELRLVGGVLAGSATLTIDGRWEWGAGAVQRTGELVISSLGQGILTGNGGKSFQAGILRNRGRILWNSGGISTSLGSPLWVNEPGSILEIQGGLTWSGTAGRIENAGTVLKLGGGIASFFPALTNLPTGTISIEGGVTDWRTGITGGGTFRAATGATMQYSAGVHDLSSAVLTGGGAFRVNGGTLVVNTGTQLRSAGLLALANGTIRLTSGMPQEIQSLELTGGILEGGDTLRVTGAGRWSGGTYRGTGSLISEELFTLEGVATKVFAGGTLRNRGKLHWLEGSILSSSSLATLHNEASAVAEFTGGFNWSGTQGRIENHGVVRKIGSMGSTYTANWVNHPGATIAIDAGNANWLGGGSGGGALVVSAGAINDFRTGNFSLQNAILSGVGTHRIGGGTVVLEAGSRIQSVGTVALAGGTLRLISGATHEVANLVLSGGVWEGSDTLRTTGSSSWLGGTFHPSGSWLNAGTLTLEGVATKVFAGGTLRNEDTLLWLEGAVLSASDPATLINEAGATIRFNGPRSWSGAAPAELRNRGRFERTGGGIGVFGVQWINEGTAAALFESGASRWTRGGGGGGTITVNAGASLHYDGGTFDYVGARAGGPGTNIINGATVQLGQGTLWQGMGSVEIATGNLRMLSGQVHALDRLVLRGGTLEGTDTFRVLASGEWTSGILQGNLSWINQGVLLVPNALSKQFLGGTLRNRGSVLFDGARLTSPTGNALLINDADGTIEFQGASGWTGVQTRLENGGLLRKTGGATLLSLGGSVLNTGTLEAVGGSITIDGPFTQTSGRTILANTSVTLDPISSRFEGGILGGTGWIASLNHNAATNAPGDGLSGERIGVLRFSPSRTLDRNAVAEFDLRGPTPGTEHDQVVIEGPPGSGRLDDVVVNGTLRARLINGFNPPVGSRFTLIRARARTGQFSVTELPPGFFVEYTPSDVVLRRDSIPVTSSPLTETIESLSWLNPDSYVIDSDAADSNPATQRDSIGVRAMTRFTSPDFRSHAAIYRMEFRLLNSHGRIIPLRDGAGNRVESIMVERAETLARSVTFPTPELITTELVSFDAAMRPAELLDARETHRVVASLFWRLPGSAEFQPTGDVTTTEPRRFLHFANTQSSDNEWNAIVEVQEVTFERTYLAESVPGKQSYRINAPLRVHRYDGFNDPQSSTSVIIEITAVLRDSTTGSLVPIRGGNSLVTMDVLNHGPEEIPSPARSDQRVTLDLEPENGAAIDILSGSYVAEISVAHRDAPAPTLVRRWGAPGTSATTPLLRLDGRLRFGAIETHFTRLANDPVRRETVTGSHVRTELLIDAGGGQIANHPELSFGSGQLLPVRVYPDGHAELVSGLVSVDASPSGPDQVNGIRFRREHLVLDENGGRADLTLLLPAGLGYRTTARSRILRHEITLGNLSLKQTLAPGDTALDTFSAELAEETKPVWLPVNRLRWWVSAGRLEFDPAGPPRFVREEEMSRLESLASQGVLAEESMKLKRANDAYLRSVIAVSSQKIIARPDANGSAVLDVSLKLGAGGMESHFPHGAGFTWDSGVIEIQGDRPAPGSSQLSQVPRIALEYSEECGECGGGTLKTMEATPAEGRLAVTPDGGLTGLTSLASPTNLEWARLPTPGVGVAHVAKGFQEARFHMPGTFLTGTASTSNPWDRPQILLLSGVMPADPGMFERPFEDNYARGEADYAGLNFRVQTDRAHAAIDMLGGVSTGQWDLTGRSKYYLRTSGISGIHEAVAGSFHAPPRIYGYEMTLPRYGLSFLGNRPSESRIEGSVHLPEASDIDQNFQRLAVTCLGDLTTPELLESEIGQLKTLQYWIADFTTLGMEFRRRASSDCAPGSGVLVLAVQGHASHITGALAGELGFLPNGEIVSPRDVASGIAALDPGFESGLWLPASFQLAGPDSGNYEMTSTSKAIFTDYGTRPADQQLQPPSLARGFLSLSARIRLPFFNEMPVQLHDTARREGGNTPIWIMDGGPEAAWSAPGDPDNRGYPVGVPTDRYHDARNANGDSERFHRPVARQRWMDLIDFEFPLEWSPASRSFRSVTAARSPEWLIVLQTERACRHLDARHVDLTFGANAEAMPVFNFVELGWTEVNREFGLTRALALSGLQTQGEAIRLGFEGLEELTTPHPTLLFQSMLRETSRPVLDRFIVELAALRAEELSEIEWQNRRQQLIDSYFGGGGSAMADALADGAARLQTLQFRERIHACAVACYQLRSILERGAPDAPARPLSRSFLRGLLRGLGSDIANAVADVAGDKLDESIDEHLGLKGIALDEVYRRLGELEQTFRDLEGDLGDQGQLHREIREVFASHGQDLDRTASQVGAWIRQRLEQTPVDENPLAGTLAGSLRSSLDGVVMNTFLAQPIVPAIHSRIRMRVVEPGESMRNAFDTTSALYSEAIRSIATAGLRKLGVAFQDFLGEIAGIAGMASVTGHAHFTGDSLTQLRVDGKMLLHLGLRCEFDGYFEIKPIESDTPNDLCIGAGEMAVEVLFGATGSMTSFGKAPNPAKPGEEIDTKDKNALSMWGKAAFSTDPALDPSRPVHLIGFSGGLHLSGSIDTGGNFMATTFGAAMGISHDAFYITGITGATFLGFDGEVGLFFGQICNGDAVYWDRDFRRIMSHDPIKGAYGFVKVRIPGLVDLGCMLKLSAHVGMGAGFVLEGPEEVPTFVGKFLVNVQGDALCILSIEGEVALAFRVGGDGLAWTGRGTFRVVLLFIDVEVTARLSMVDGEIVGEIE